MARISRSPTAQSMAGTRILVTRMKDSRIGPLLRFPSLPHVPRRLRAVRVGDDTEGEREKNEGCKKAHEGSLLTRRVTMSLQKWIAVKKRLNMVIT